MDRGEEAGPTEVGGDERDVNVKEDETWYEGTKFETVFEGRRCLVVSVGEWSG